MDSSKAIFLLIYILVCSCNERQKAYDYSGIKDSIDFYQERINLIKSNDTSVYLYNNRILDLSKKIKNDSVRISCFYQAANNFYNNKNIKDFKSVSNIIIQEGFKTKDTLAISKGYINLGDYYLAINKKDSAFYFFDKAEINFITNNLYKNANSVRLRKAILQYYENDILGCETTIYKSLPYYKKINNQVQLNISYSLLGLCKIETKEFEEGLSFLNIAEKHARGLPDDNGSKQSSINNIALLYFKKEDYKEAIDFYNKLNNDSIKKDFPTLYTYARQHIAFSNYKLGKINNFKTEYDFVLESYKNLNLSIVQPLTQLSEFYESQNDLEKAQEFAKQAYNISIKEKLYRDKLIALKQLNNVFPEESKFYSSEYIKLSDSIAAVDKKVQNTFARIEYRVDELNSENLLLAERNKQIMYYSIIGILVMSMFYFYRWQKQKQRELILIQEQQQANEEVYTLMLDQQNKMDQVKAQEQKRISQELHDAVLGKLFGARMNLDFLNSQMSDAIKKDKEKYIHEIIEVEKQIRQISHELNDEKRTIINNYQLMIDKLVEEQEKLLDLKINYILNTKIPWEKISAEEKINLYRIFQETFHNIVKYATPKKVDFSFNFDNNVLKIIILDDGIGFDLNKAAKGIGIKNMKERAKLINAKYIISSVINKGTQTLIELEINPNKEF